jgi:hypothetical protein
MMARHSNAPTEVESHRHKYKRICIPHTETDAEFSKYVDHYVASEVA